MKMVSQLTRQAMNRHRTLNACIEPVHAAAAPPPITPPDIHMPDTLTASAGAQTTRSYPRSDTSVSKAEGLHPQSIYRQLMKSHDRMTQRHL